jgi:adenylate cyclase
VTENGIDRPPGRARRLLKRRGFGRRVAAIGIGLFSLVIALTIRAGIPEVPTLASQVTFDAYQRLSPRPYGDAPVRVVDIDEASLAAFGQWPWPRTRVAALLERLSALGAAAIVFDILFAEPDQTSPLKVVAALPVASEQDRERLTQIVAPLPDHDQAFASALEAKPAVLGFALSPTPNERRPILKSGVVYAGADPAAILPPFAGAVPPIPVLEGAASGIGSVSLSRNDTSGVVRRVPMLFSDGERTYPSLVVEALRVAQGASSIIVRSTGASGEKDVGVPALVELKVGELRAPLTRDGEMWLRYDRERPERYLSARELLAPAGDEVHDAALRARVEGQIVFVGTSAAGLLDIRATPLGETVPGVSIHAQAAEQILAGNFIARPDWAEGLELVATVAFCLIVIAFLLVLDASLAFAVITAVMLLIVGGAWLIFTDLGLLLEPVVPSLSAGGVFMSVLAVLYFSSDREKRFIRQAFGQYIVPELIKKLEESPGALKLGGETRRLSIMFLDIRGFTGISEALSADELVTLLNRLFSPLSDAIFREQGTIDKYIGDSIMAFWNAPVEVSDHPLRACRAALAMRTIVDELNAGDAFGFAARGRSDLQVKIGVGINTGTACVGNMGSERRFNYSVIGDAVNVAARIEASCKEMGVDILISESVAEAVPHLAVLEAGEVVLRGKSHALKLFALVGDESLAAASEFRELARLHASLLAAAEVGRSDARAMLETCRALAGPWFAPFYARLEERLVSRARRAGGST